VGKRLLNFVQPFAWPVTTSPMVYRLNNRMPVCTNCCNPV